ncbi:unnamed protein product [Cyprideis torosa]|uniref:Clathrin light chain n=1 Tax=Cyprideis torosa TaxID=163714 RepID=A0A7R8ZI68_9CRUS|nr:unnamed protein product [Cyprideis torosa]CAG0884135.1 unnamed protein product [Cyprideis torosa]
MSGLLNGDVDPAADFLKREQDELGGLADEVVSAGGGLGAAAASTSDAAPSDDDFGFLEAPPTTSEVKQEPSSTNNSAMRSTPSPALVKEEAEKIVKWREEQKIRLMEKDEEEKREIEVLRNEAKRALTEWQRNHDEQIAKTRKANLEAEEDHEATAASVGTENGSGESGQLWERISKLCEFNPKNARGTKDTSRMRGIILQLKQNPPLPPVSRLSTAQRS